MKYFGTICLFLLCCGIGIPQILFARTSNDPYIEQDTYHFVKAYDAWNYTTGSRDVIVAIIDNGFDTFHPDLIDNIWKNVDEICNNGIDDDHNDYVDDCYGWNFFDNTNDPRPDPTQSHDGQTIHHATLVAGIIGARGDNNTGGAGINWQVRLMNVKVLGNTGAGNINSLPLAIRYAVDNGADVINVSLVGNLDNGVSDAVQYAYDHGVVVVAAAGNNRISLNSYPFYPVCSDNGTSTPFVLGVNAVTLERTLAEFSNIGSDCVDITSPGVQIKGPLRYSPTNGLTELFSYDTVWQGTSFAAPFVSGAAALIKSIQPTWTPDTIFDALFRTVSKTPPKDEELYTNFFGRGLVQIGPAVEYAYSQLATSSYSNVFEHGYGVFQLDSGFAALNSFEVAKRQPELLGAVDVTGFYYDDALWMVTSHFDADQKNTTLTFYTGDEWVQSKQLSFFSEVPVSVRVGNIVDSSSPEIVLSPLEESTTLFSVYDFSGALIYSIEHDIAHTGVSLNITPSSDRVSYQDILVSYEDDSQIVVQRYTNNITPVFTYQIPLYTKPASVLFDDVTGDGVFEYVIASGERAVPSVQIITQEGTVVSEFFPFGNTYVGGIELLAVQSEANGSEKELLVSKQSGTRVLSVYTSQGEKKQTVYPFSRSAELSSSVKMRAIR